jgi:hypothetical protein
MDRWHKVEMSIGSDREPIPPDCRRSSKRVRSLDPDIARVEREGIATPDGLDQDRVLSIGPSRSEFWTARGRPAAACRSLGGNF